MFSLNSALTKAYYKLGWTIAIHPKKFIAFPLIVTFFMTLGFINFTFKGDFEKMYSPTTGPSVLERELVEKYFKTDDAGFFNVARKAKFGRFLRIYASAKDGGNILRPEIWKEFQLLDDFIKNASIIYNGKSYKYTDLCARWGDECFSNDLLELGESLPAFQQSKFKIGFPIAFDPVTYKIHSTGHFTADPVTDESGVNLKSAKFILLNFFLVSEELEDESTKKAAAWESGITKLLLELKPKLKEVDFFLFTINGLDTESTDNFIKVLTVVPFSVIPVATYIVLSLMTKDWVRAKPWLGTAGSLAAVFGILASFGLLLTLKVPFIAINMSVPFIMIGIGIDDSFVLVAAWRRTSIHKSVPTRLAETFSDASVSITITSLTDMCSFLAGVATPLPAIKIFSIYSAVTIVFVYVWQLFFLGGCMAISGYQEEKYQHGVFFWMKAVPKSEAGSLPYWKRLLLTGGPSSEPSKATSEIQSSENKQMTFFRETFASLLLKQSTQYIVAILYLGYLAASLYGILNLNEDVYPQRIFRRDSYLHDFFVTEENHLPEYYMPIHVLITTPLDYSDPSIQAEISTLLSNLTSIDYISTEFSENWLQNFLSWAKIYGEFEPIDISTKSSFISTLRNQYLGNNSRPISTDIVFNPENTEIIASRFMLQTKGIKKRVVGLKHAIVTAREITAALKPKMNVTVTTYWNRFLDQGLMIRPLAVKLVAFVSFLVLATVIIFIPSITVALSVFFSIVSTQWGVVGAMSYWGVSLDSVSVISLIMCIGFSVDFATHFSYAWASSKTNDIEEKMRSSLHAIGLPVVQGALSTIIGCVALTLIPSYMYETVVKLVVLVMVFSTAHALIILPIVLMWISLYKCWGEKGDIYYVTKL